MGSSRCQRHLGCLREVRGQDRGPARWWGAIPPAVAALGALYVVGHRSAIRIGPRVDILRWQISLAFDVAVAVAAALLAGLLQRAGLRLLEPEQRGARGNGLA